MAKKVILEQIHSKIGATRRQKATIDALGFKKSKKVVEKELTPAIQGMIDKVAHLVRVKE